MMIVEMSTSTLHANENEKDEEEYGEEEEEFKGCIEGCCRNDGSDSGPRCMCLPYKDPWIITAQGFSILAFILSLLWWVTAVLGLLSMIMLQLVWCIRQPHKGLLVASQILSIGASLAALAAGIYSVLAMVEDNWCEIFFVVGTVGTVGVGGAGGYGWICKDVIIVFFVDGLLWAATAGCSIAFLCTGNYAKWEAHHHANKKNEEGTTTAAPARSRRTTTTNRKNDEEEKEEDNHGNSMIANKASKPATIEEDEETAITTTTTINDVAFAPIEMMEQMVDDDDDDDDNYNETNYKEASIATLSQNADE